MPPTEKGRCPSPRPMATASPRSIWPRKDDLRGNETICAQSRCSKVSRGKRVGHQGARCCSWKVRAIPRRKKTGDLCMDHSAATIIAESINAASQADVWTVISALANVLLLATAIVAALYARSQVKVASAQLAAARDELTALASSNQEAAATEKARFLFSLDQMFESDIFTQSRAEFSDLLEKHDKAASDAGPALNDRQWAEHVGQAFAATLIAMRSDDRIRYHRVLKLCGFFETVAVLAKDGHVSLASVTDLYGPAIEYLADAVGPYIRKLQKDDGDARLYVNFLWLAEEVERAKTSAKAP